MGIKKELVLDLLLFIAFMSCYYCFWMNCVHTSNHIKKNKIIIFLCVNKSGHKRKLLVPHHPSWKEIPQNDFFQNQNIVRISQHLTDVVLTMPYDKLTHAVIQAYNLQPVYPSGYIWTLHCLRLTIGGVRLYTYFLKFYYILLLPAVAVSLYLLLHFSRLKILISHSLIWTLKFLVAIFFCDRMSSLDFTPQHPGPAIEDSLWQIWVEVESFAIKTCMPMSALNLPQRTSSQAQASLTFKALRQENFKFMVAHYLVRAQSV